MFIRSVAGIVLLSIALSAFGGELCDNEMIIGGASSEADGLWVSNPSLCLRRDTPGVAFGMVQVPGKDRFYAYVLVIKGDEQRKVLAHYDSKGGVSGSAAISQGFVEIANKKVAFQYTVKVDPTGKQPPQGVLSINSKALEIGKGRVVLIDLSAENVNWKQLPIDLPKSPTSPTETAQVESQSKKVLEDLRRGNKNVRDFLK
jgi:hypothetical protein